MDVHEISCHVEQRGGGGVFRQGLEQQWVECNVVAAYISSQTADESHGARWMPFDHGDRRLHRDSHVKDTQLIPRASIHIIFKIEYYCGTCL